MPKTKKADIEKDVKGLMSQKAKDNGAVVVATLVPPAAPLTPTRMALEALEEEDGEGNSMVGVYDLTIEAIYMDIDAELAEKRATAARSAEPEATADDK